MAIIAIVIAGTSFPWNLVIAGVLVLSLLPMIGLGASIFDYGVRHGVKNHLGGTNGTSPEADNEPKVDRR